MVEGVIHCRPQHRMLNTVYKVDYLTEFLQGATLVIQLISNLLTDICILIDLSKYILFLNDSVSCVHLSSLKNKI